MEGAVGIYPQMSICFIVQKYLLDFCFNKIYLPQLHDVTQHLPVCTAIIEHTVNPLDSPHTKLIIIDLLEH